MKIRHNIKRLVSLAVILMMTLPAVALAGTANYVYDDVDRLNVVHTTYGTGVSNSADYGYDAVGNMTSRIVNGPDISVDPAAYDFGAIGEGQSSSAQTITVTNNGTGSLNIGTIAINGTDAGDFSTQNDNCSSQSISASGNCTLQVAFSPDVGGARNAALSIPSDDSAVSTLEVPLSGYAVPYYDLTTTLVGSGFGNVTSAPTGIDCGNGLYSGSDCSEAYLVDTQVTLTANPDPESTFIGWSGSWCSGTDPCTVTMDRTNSVTATFTAYYDLNVTVQGSGLGNVTSSPSGIECGSGTADDCTELYLDGTEVTLTATPGGNDVFTGWSGGGCSGTDPCTVYIGDDTDVAATFATHFNLSVDIQGSGLGNVASYVESDQYTVLLLHNDGSDGSTAFADDSDSSHIVSANGNAQIDTAQSQFGGASALFDGSGDYLNIADSDDWNSGSGDFTIDFWARWNGTPGSSSLVGQSNGGSDNLKWLLNWNGITSGKMTFHYHNPAGTVHNVSFAWSPSADTWYHLAIVRSGVSWYFFVNGVQTDATQTEAAVVPDVSSALWVGGDGEGWQYLNGWIDELKVSKGVARWTSNFTPPSEPYFKDMGIECGSGTANDCSEDYLDGTLVKLVPVPDAGDVFTGWSGGGCSGLSPCAVTVTGITNVTATFSQGYELDVTVSGSGSGSVESSPEGISCGSGTPDDCTSLYAEDSQVTLTATYDTGSEFDGWSGGGCSGTGNCVVTMTNATSVTATFINAPAIDVDPSSHSYGNVPRGDSANYTFEVSNIGYDDLVLGNIIINGTDASDFTLNSDDCSGQTLVPTESCTFDVAFSPNAVGSRTANAEIPSNDPYTLTEYVSLSGIGTSSQNIRISSPLFAEDFSAGIPEDWTVSGIWNGSNPCSRSIGSPFATPWAIADSYCESASVDQLYTPIFNATACSEMFLLFDNQFDWYDSSSRAALALSNDGGQGWANAVVMTSDDGYPTPNTKEITVGSAAGASEAQLKFKYESSASEGYWAIDNVWPMCTPAELTFKGFINATSPAQTVMVYNRGFDDLTIGTVDISGTDASYFDIQGDGCSSEVLGTDEGCAVDVVFTPTDIANRAASLDIPSNDPDTSTASAPLDGEIGNVLDEALYIEELKPGTDPDSTGATIYNATDYMGDGLTYTGPGYSIQKSQGKYNIMSFRSDSESSNLSAAMLHVYTPYVSGSQSVSIYAYQSDGDAIDTSTYLTDSLVSGWNDIDVSGLLSLMDGYGFIKFRIINSSGTSVNITEAKIAVIEN